MTAPLPAGLQNFDEFWPHYLEQHRRAGCRVMHYLAAITAVTLLVIACCAACPWTMMSVPIAAYLLAWLGHALIERNRPATWRYPVWSLRAEVRMVTLAVRGRLGDELRRAGPGTSARPDPPN